MRLTRVRGVPLAGVPSQRWAKLLRERPMNRCSEDQSVTARKRSAEGITEELGDKPWVVAKSPAPPRAEHNVKVPMRKTNDEHLPDAGTHRRFDCTPPGGFYVY